MALVAVVQVGAPAPPDVNTCPAVPAAIPDAAVVLVAYNIPPAALNVPKLLPSTLAASPFNVAVIVPALKFPLASLATIVEAVLAFVALLVTVNVAALDPLNVVLPLNPVPDVLNVNVLLT